MHAFTSIFSLLVAAAGWYYMFYSRAASNLTGIEDEQLNHRRQRLRQIGGFVMLLLAVALFAGFHTVDAKTSAQAFLLVWMAVFLLLMTIVLLAMVDLRLTWKLRHRRRGAGFEVHPPKKMS
jgi:drug/metabolite transporter (DMT)-like permease